MSGKLLITAWLLLSSTAFATNKVRFNDQIRPLLSDRCNACHGPDEKHREAELRLDTRAGAVGEHGAIIPGDPEKSPLWQRITAADPADRMPPPSSKKPAFTATELALLKRWIEEGAEYEGHWSFLPLRTDVPPLVKDARNPVDSFVRSKLVDAGIAPSPPADRMTFIRRVTLDLLGVLPTPEEVADFVADEHPAAEERLIDRLLASPRYGERWGRHWLDQARYADSNGYAIDAPRDMWPYRDWVIDAINRDLPFDQFTIEQLAGDLLDSPTKAQLVATGFHRNTLINQEGGTDREQFRVEATMDRANTTGAVWLGLTVGCAQCHTHKFDPVTHEDYYRLFAFFNSAQDANDRGPAVEVIRGEMFGQPVPIPMEPKPPSAAEIEKWRTAWEETTRERLAATAGEKSSSTDNALLAILQKDHKDRTEAERKQLQAAFEKAEPRAKPPGKKPANPDIVQAMVMRDQPTPRETYLLTRGDFTRPDTERGPLSPGIFAAIAPSAPELRTRLDLAKWLVHPDNPLTPRVTVNRHWMRFFGRGIVETDEDFGAQGAAPSHPALLDWLGREFQRRGWSSKALHRAIVSSAVYQQSSRSRPDLSAKDPRNLWLARQERFRLEAEIVRDAALSASGLLVDTVGGPSVHPPQPEGVYAFTQVNKAWPTDTGRNRFRRGLYTFFFRSAPYPLFTTFDTPDFQSTCTRRPRSNTPLQALTVANDPAFFELAQGLAMRLATDIPGSFPTTLDERLHHGARLCFGRELSPKEATILRDYLRQEHTAFAKDPNAAKMLTSATLKSAIPDEDAAVLVLFARTLFNADSFITRE